MGIATFGGSLGVMIRPREASFGEEEAEEGCEGGFERKGLRTGDSALELREWK